MQATGMVIDHVMDCFRYKGYSEGEIGHISVEVSRSAGLCARTSTL